MALSTIENRSQTAHVVKEDMAKKTVKKLSSDLLRKSKGLKIKTGDQVLVHYQGTLLNREEFDANFDFSTFEAVVGREAFPFTLRVGQVIEGWDKV